jgi:cholesterol transport system auxiliary component
MSARCRLCQAALVAAAVLLLPACTFNAPSREAPALYGLGEHAGHAGQRHSIPGTLLIPPVGSPAWLETTGIMYRLNYDDPQRLRAYTSSRWVASPAMLLTEELRSRFAGRAERVVSGTDGAQADSVLRVELEEYTQSFDVPEHSRVTLRARATLVDRKSRDIVGQRTFRVEREAAPNAAGAAATLAECSAQFIENLLDWVAENLKNSGAASTAQRSAR